LQALSLEPSVGVFYHFYGIKDVNKWTWILISAHPGKNLFPPHACNIKKEWCDSFSRVQGVPECSSLSVMVEEKPKYPLFLTSSPVVVMGYEFKKMSLYEQGIVCFLDKFLLMNIHKLMNREGDSKSLDAYLRECCFDLLLLLLLMTVAFLTSFTCAFVETMMPLSGVERKKYLADLNAKKAAEGYSASDPADVLHRKLKGKDAASKANMMVGSSKMDVDTEATGDGVLDDQVDSQKLKKMRIGKGESKKVLVTSEKDDDNVETTSLNAPMEESFWHSDFNSRRCGS
jgi:hypothetical protein